MSDSSYTLESGDQFVDASIAFSGAGITYTVSGIGAEIDPSAGVVTHATGSMLPKTEIVVTAANDGGSAQVAYLVSVVEAQPTIVGSLSDQIWAESSGAKTVETSAVFSGTNLTYSVTGGGASIDPSTGMVTHGTSNVLTGTTITVSATNSAGSVAASYDVTVQRAAPIVASLIPDQNLIQSSGFHTLDASASFSGTNLTYSISGVSVTIDPTTGEITHDLSTAIEGELMTVSVTNEGGSAQVTYLVTIATSGYSVSDAILGVDVILNDLGDGSFEAVITGSAGYNGRYPLTKEQLDSGLPICLVEATTIFSDPTFTATPGLWIYPTDDAPIITQAWYVEGVYKNTGLTYDRQSGEENFTIIYREEATNLSDSVTTEVEAQGGSSFSPTVITLDGVSYGKVNYGSEVIEAERTAAYVCITDYDTSTDSNGIFALPDLNGSFGLFDIEGSGSPGYIQGLLSGTSSSYTAYGRFSELTPVLTLVPSDVLHMVSINSTNAMRFFMKKNSDSWFEATPAARNGTSGVCNYKNSGDTTGWWLHGKYGGDGPQPAGAFYRATLWLDPLNVDDFLPSRFGTKAASMDAFLDTLCEADGTLKHPSLSTAALGNVQPYWDIYDESPMLANVLAKNFNNGTGPQLDEIAGTFT